MTVREALKEAKNKLIMNRIETPGLITGVLLAHVLQRDKAWLIAHPEEKLTPQQIEIFTSYVERAAAGEPVSYILGYREFMSLRFEVGRGVLIPRPETELLVEAAINYIKTENRFREKPPLILDICCGSGCIAVSLAKFLQKSGYNCRITGVDIADTALYYSEKNAKNHGVSHMVSFYLADVLQADEKFFTSLVSGEKYDLLVSNPPYIPSGDLASLEPGVRDFEPALALNGGHDGLDFYRRITFIASRILKNKGRLFFEAGYNQADSIKSIMSGNFSDITVIKDYSGIDRVIHGMLN